MNSYRKFFFAFFLFLMVFVGFCLFLNFKMDPYDIWGNHSLIGINHVKNGQANHERLLKTFAVMRLRPKTLFLGSSRTRIGLDPRHPIFSSRREVYNLGISAVNMEELTKLFEHAFANQPQLEEVVLGLDFFMFNELHKNRPDFDEELVGRTRVPLKTMLEPLFSNDALKASWDTFLFNRSTPSKRSGIRPDGMEDIYVTEEFAQEGNKYENGEHAAPLSRKDFFGGSIRFHLSGRDPDNYLYGAYRYSQSAFQYLARMVKICQEKKIRLILFISPSHAIEWEIIRITGLWREFEKWKGFVAALHPFWDFSGYNSVTTEEISEEMKNYADHSHYLPRVGNWVLNRLFYFHEKEVPKDFGVLVTPQNAEKHFSRIRSEQAVWIRRNSKIIEWLKEIQSEVK